MERTKKVDKAKWKKVGGGSFTFNNKIIKPGQVFEADANDIPEAFKDLIEPYNTAARTKVTHEITDSKFTLDMVEKGAWNILDAEGKIVNEEPIAKGEAQKLIDELEKE